MTIINTYKPPTFTVLTEPPTGPFDAYFNGPVPEKLESNRVRLEVYNPAIHAKAYWAQHESHRTDIEKYLPLSWPDYTTFLTWTHNFIIRDPESLLFAIIDRTKPNDGANYEESIAGLIGYLHFSPHNLSVEIGPVIILPRAQKTFVSSNAIGLLLKHALNLPEEGGLGFRRVSWTANPNNVASVRTAQRMGLTIEGVTRWSWVLPEGKDGGKSPVDGKRGQGQGRDSTVLSVCWDDWEAGAKEIVQKAMDRTS